MPQSEIPNNLPSVEKLIARISAAEKGQQKEIRITTVEARELALDLALLTSKLGVVIKDISESLKKMQASSEKIDIKMDGGGF